MKKKQSSSDCTVRPLPVAVTRTKATVRRFVAVGIDQSLFANTIPAKDGTPKKSAGKSVNLHVTVPPRGDTVDVFFVIRNRKGEPVQRPVSDFAMRSEKRSDGLDGRPNEAIGTEPGRTAGFHTCISLPGRTFARTGMKNGSTSPTGQAAQDPADRERQSGAVMFRYDGKFASNPKLPGEWKTVAVVPTIDSFTPGKRTNARRARFARIRFKDNGETGSAVRLWPGETLIELSRYDALKIKLRAIAGETYVFIEAGGFSKSTSRAGSRWYVLNR